ncbi:MAG: CehA/McbA family metallohydrolase [Myxococcota bacterium]
MLRFSRGQRFWIGNSLLGLLAPILFWGCSEANSERTRTNDSTLQEEELGSALASFPWFTPPEDWDEQHPVLSPNAKIEAHFLVLADREIVPNPADGGGRAWLESVRAIDPEPGSSPWQRSEEGEGARPIVPASSDQRIELVFEVGPRGIEEGGLLFVMSEPFWSWSPTQVENPEAPGYTTAMARGDGAELVPILDGATFRIEGRRLEPLERIDIVVGAGPLGIRVDEFAERGSEILIAVDADGDGTRAWIKQSARLGISAGPGSRLVALGPAEVSPGDSIELVLSLVDGRGNRARWPNPANDQGDHATLEWTIEHLAGPSLAMLGLEERIESKTEVQESSRIRFEAPATEGTIRLSIRGRGALDGFHADVHPIVVRESERHLIWADLHGHSGLSDGTGTPDDYFRYARDVARLDAIALTDHDHWGLRPLDQSEELADKILESALRFHERDRFVTIPGYEWTSWLHGHRHVLYFDEVAPIYSSVDFATDRPDELWAALRGQPVLTFAHHSAGEPVATNWAFRPDPILEPLTEISSIHGMSEADDAPMPVYGAISGNFVRDVLLRGARLGFIGSGDSHDGHPGLAHLSAAGQSGLAGIFTDTLDRPGLLEAMRKRRTFATNGIRPWLAVHLDKTFMGSALPAGDDRKTEHRLQIRYEATAPIERIDLIRSGRIASLPGEGAMSLDFVRQIPRLGLGEFHYVRIIQTDGGVAWSSPIFVDGPEG